MTQEQAQQQILAVNDRFYTALAEGDLITMATVWYHGEATECIHPGWDRLRGWEAIYESWVQIFHNQGPMPIKPSHPQVHIRGNMAWVTCNENILVQGDRMFSMSRTVATNIFEHIDGAWYMVIHHASQVPADDGRRADLN